MKRPMLILGCNGREQNYVQFCAGTAFPLIDLNSVPPTDQVLEKYLYEKMHLDRGPIKDHNQVVNIIQFLTEHYLEEKFSASIMEWLNVHKRCGMYIYRSFDER